MLKVGDKIIILDMHFKDRMPGEEGEVIHVHHETLFTSVQYYVLVKMDWGNHIMLEGDGFQHVGIMEDPYGTP